MTDLTSLIDRLVKAQGPDQELDGEIWLAAIPGASRKNLLADHPDEKPLWEYHDVERNTCFRGGIIPSYTRSIDAAVSLAERVLPGVEIELTNLYSVARATLFHETGQHYGTSEIDSLPIAICLAILTALQSKGEA